MSIVKYCDYCGVKFKNDDEIKEYEITNFLSGIVFTHYYHKHECFDKQLEERPAYVVEDD